MNRRKAMIYRAAIVAGAKSLPDADAIDAPMLFDRWEVGKAYVVGDRICYEEVLYKCVQAHTSQADWMPSVTPALWTVVSVEEFPEWVQPTGVQDAYMMGDKVSHNSRHWISTVDNNVWEPSVYGWDEID